MVGDYISTSFTRNGLAATVFAIGLPHAGTTFDEGMWTPTSPLAIATKAMATSVASSNGVRSSGGTGQGELLRSIRND
jgi:hypothetical protein